MPSLLDQLASDRVLAEAFRWLCETRNHYHYHYNDDVWHVRHWWAREQRLLQAQLRAGTYRLSECRLVRGRERTSEIWCATDALVLKALALVLTAHLNPHLSRRCFHLAGRGGLKGAVRTVAGQAARQTFVFRTDVKSYYASIDHRILFDLVRHEVKDPAILSLIWQYLTRVMSDGGDYTAIERGIALGCPLSPLMGALYLKPLDDRMAQMGCGYVRYMGDWVVLAPTRWKLRAAIRAVNQVMAQLRVRQHSDKTIIGRIARGFDFLGYRFSSAGLAVARQTVERCVARISQLYEQGAAASRIGAYVQGWERWVRAGLGGMVVEIMAASQNIVLCVHVIDRVSQAEKKTIAVGTVIADRPPHRSVRAALPHTALTLDDDDHPARRRRAAARTPSSPRDLEARRCVRSSSHCSTFSLVSPLPSTDSADSGPLSLFAGFCGTMELSDSPATCLSDLWPRAFSDQSAPQGETDVAGVSRLP